MRATRRSPPAIPRALRIEATPACQLRCPLCPTARGDTRPTLGRGHLSAAALRKLLAENPSTRRIELSNYGEMFLHPRLSELLEIAAEHGVRVTADNGANLNHASAAVLEDVVKFRVHSITCSIDGATRETYALYRRGGDFGRVLSNIESINRHKKAYRSRYPILTWQFVVFRHNEHEIDEARKLASRLGMRFRLKHNWDEDPDSAIAASGRLGARSPAEYRERFKISFDRLACHQLWHSPQINWDGKLLGCCVNYWGDFGGNVFRDGLGPAIDGERMRYAREMLAGRREPRSDVPCTTCHVYKSMRETGAWIQPIERLLPLPVWDFARRAVQKLPALRVALSLGLRSSLSFKRTARKLIGSGSAS